MSVWPRNPCMGNLKTKKFFSKSQLVKDEGDAHETEVWDEDVTMTTMLELKNALRVNVEVRWLNLLTKRGKRWRWRWRW